MSLFEQYPRCYYVNSTNYNGECVNFSSPLSLYLCYVHPTQKLIFKYLLLCQRQVSIFYNLKYILNITSNTSFLEKFSKIYAKRRILVRWLLWFKLLRKREIDGNIC
jgi:hypothetical protein